MSDTVIHTSNLSRVFRDIRAVDTVTFDIPRGIVFGFLGPNGAGKTTTIRLLLGLLEPSSGSAEVFGLDTVRYAAQIRERTGALLEHTGLYERLSAESNLEFYGRVYRMPNAERAARIQEILERFDLWGRRKERVGSWSRGMKQKLAVARAMLHRPKLLFLDEPTAGLDPIAAAGLRDTLASLVADDGLTVFLTTHNLAEAEKLCSSVGMINHGKLVTVGPPDRLSTQEHTYRVDITCTTIGDDILLSSRQLPVVASIDRTENGLAADIERGAKTSPLVRHLVKHGIEIEEVQRERASLEETFLKLMEEENGQ